MGQNNESGRQIWGGKRALWELGLTVRVKPSLVRASSCSEGALVLIRGIVTHCGANGVRSEQLTWSDGLSSGVG